MAWTELPQGEEISIKGGYFYAVVAMVKNNHDATAIKNMIAQKNLQLVDYQDPVQGSQYTADSGYRIVAVQVLATQDGGTIPWGVPGILSWADNSHMLRAWTAPQQEGSPPTPPTVPASSSSVGWWLLGAALAAGGGLWWLHTRRRRA